uniref:Transposon TX1 n=1 Tax=Tanacetum cinerariifolium TaxID=118510 RepID=A0A6L2KCH4_TANCI|nr:transposon TX1 [Tanacetum cinerariifolium]
MGNLWMMFKKFRTVFDMYMVQKRLRNRERYGFVRFKLVTNVDELLKRLGEIKFGEENLTVFIAYDKKNLGAREAEGNQNVRNEMRKERSVFKKIVALHGRVIGSSNCELESNQNLIVDVIEEVGDVMKFEMEEKGVIGKNKIEHKETHENRDVNDMVISESSDDGTNLEDERDEINYGEKRGVHPTSSSSCGDDRINKKRKTKGDVEDDVISNMNENTSIIKDVKLNEANKTNVFNEGVDNGTWNNGKKRGGYKETFVFRSTGLADSNSKGCSINIEHVKEIGEIIGVSWAKAENEKVWGVETVKNQGDVNGALGYKKKAVVITSDPLALVTEKMNVSKQKGKVVVSLDSKGSGSDDFSELKKITALLAKAFNRRKFYSKPTNNNLRTSSISQSTNKKQEFVKSDGKKVEKKADEKKRDMSKVKCYNCKKEGHFAKDCKKAKEIIANMVFMAQIEKVLSESDESSSSAKETIAEVAYYTSESESESEFETSKYYDNSTNYGLFVNNDDD